MLQLDIGYALHPTIASRRDAAPTIKLSIDFIQLKVTDKLPQSVLK